MPLYEYKCDNCGEVFEVMQKFADEPVSVHEKCGGPVHRLISSPAFQFKGSGWYVNDYGKGNNGPRKSDKESKPSGDTKSDSKSSESTSSESKSSGSKPSESKSTESKPAGGDKPKAKSE
jgi:putative FmdB family regulatory protein